LAIHARADRARADIALLDRIVARDQDALGELYDRYSRLLFGLIVRILGDRGESEDVLQETFVQIWLRAETYRRTLGSPVGWLVGIARHRAIDRLRARGPNRVTLDLEALATAEDRDAHPDVNERAAIRRALSALPADQRELIEQAFFLGFTHSELAERTGVPLGTIKTRIRAGIKTLREHFEAAFMQQ
jgi:RNA polymerase sigma-70 factor (ECF subfamily)